MTPRRILLIGSNYRPEPVGIGPYTAGLAEGLVGRGHAVTVVTGQPHYPEWRISDGYGGRTSSLERGVQVVRCPHYVPFRPRAAKRIAHYASFARAAYRPSVAVARSFAPDCVVAVLPSLLNIHTARRAARTADAHLWAHIQDFEVEAAFATDLLSDRLASPALTYEGRQLRRAGTISTISPQMRARLIAKDVPRSRVVELRNWANHVAAISASEGRTVRMRHDVGERTMVLYSGSIARKQGFDTLIEAARRLEGREDLVFMVRAPEAGRLAWEQDAPGNMLFGDLVPDDEIGEFLKAADVHVLPQKAQAADLVLPSKLSNMLASGRPVVATAAPGTGLAEEIEGCGIATPPGDPEALASAIASLTDPAMRRKLGIEAERRATQRWTLEAVLDAFEARLAEVL